MDAAVGKINVSLCEAIQFTDSETCAQQNYNVIVIVTLAVISDKLQIQKTKLQIYNT